MSWADVDRRAGRGQGGTQVSLVQTSVCVSWGGWREIPRPPSPPECHHYLSGSTPDYPLLVPYR